MNKKKTLWVMLALVIGLVLAGCSDDSSSDSGVSLPGNKAVSALPNYDVVLNPIMQNDGPDVAIAMFNAVYYSYDSLSNLLAGEDYTAYGLGFTVATGKTQQAFNEELKTKKSASLSVPINYTTPITNTISNSSFKLSITGNSNGSFSSNLNYLDWDTNDLTKKGDWVSLSSSVRRTFAITEGFYEFSYYGKTYKVAGFITTEYSSNSKNTLTDVEFHQDTGNDSGTEKVAVALTISDGVKGAKFRFSAASTGSGNWRYAGSSSDEYVFSDVEIYDNGNNLVKKIPADRFYSTDDWLDFASSFNYF